MTAKKDDHQIVELTRRLDEVTHQWKRAVADYQNLERQTNEAEKVIVGAVKSATLARLLPLLDGLETVVQSCPQKERENSWFEGVAMVVAQWKDVLRDEGVGEIAADGQPFDPKLHEVIDTVEGEDPNMIAHVYTKGYCIGTMLLRPARVRVTVKKEQKPHE
ncbi:MAG: nucleotide exchange factor GrpE [bacterium]|nr:nucleotide exchange factor GrpE [bacterium]